MSRQAITERIDVILLGGHGTVPTEVREDLRALVQEQYELGFQDAGGGCETVLGAYTGGIQEFVGKRGVIRLFGMMCKIQFDVGERWLTQSWITVPTSDVTVDSVQTLNAAELAIDVEVEEEVSGDVEE